MFIQTGMQRCTECESGTFTEFYIAEFAFICIGNIRGEGYVDGDGNIRLDLIGAGARAYHGGIFTNR